MTDGDPFDLHRFVEAQAPVFDAALAELRGGRKRSHWMWFVFPQLRGLGSSSTAAFYGIGSLAEAQAYLAHPLLGPRLDQCTDAVMAVAGKSLHDIFGAPDDVKFRSSMTLFARAAGDDDSVFSRAIDRYYGGRRDERTLALLGVC
jgi:uncharacterized protein (DUF1810 family)